jgi:hypothetical protein
MRESSDSRCTAGRQEIARMRIEGALKLGRQAPNTDTYTTQIAVERR